MHALIIEDELLIAAELELILKQIGFLTVAIATTEEDAVRSALRTRPNLIVSDVILEAGTGLNAIARIEQKIDTTVIYVTATPNIAGFGSRMVVRKPIDETQLKVMIGKTLSFAG